jgi:GNAT superfamily N-acetyltransferase
VRANVGERPSQQEWRTRWVQPDDADAVVDLLNTVYDDWGNRDYWWWKYQQPLTPFRLPSAVADLNGQIIGHYGIVPLKATLSGKTVRGAQVVDAAVLPAWRHHGIFMTLARYVLDHAVQAGVTLIYAFPGLLSLAMNHRLGFSSIAFVPEMVRVLRPWQALMLALRLLPGDIYALCTAHREAYWPPDTVRRLARLRRSLLFLTSWASDPAVARYGESGKTIVEHNLAEGFDARFDTLWAQVSGNTDLGVYKDASYLTWRYRLNPRGCYRVFVAKRGTEMVGFLVIRHTGPNSDITELVALPGCTDVVLDLLATAIAQARRAGSLVLTAWAPARHPYYASLRRAGFVSQMRLHRLSERCPVLARWLYQVIDYAQHLSPDQQNQLAVLAKTWSLTMGDSDLV